MNPVVYARLPGAQHSFDPSHSVRFQYVIDGIEAFTAWVWARRDPASAPHTTGAPLNPSRTHRGPSNGRLADGAGLDDTSNVNY